MIVWIQEKDHVSITHHPDKTSITLCNEQVHLHSQDTCVYVRAHASLHFTCLPLPYNIPVSFINRTADIQGIIIVEKGELDLHPYVRKQHMVINDTKECDLYVPSGKGYLHIDDNMVSGMHMQFPFACCGKPVQKCTVSSQQWIAFYPYIIWFEKDFLLIHGKDVRLPVFHSGGSCVHDVQEIPETDGYQPKIVTVMNAKLKEPRRMQTTTASNGMMLPSILMGMASLSVAGINSFRMIEQGKGIVDILPMLLIPCTMVVSSVFVMPLLTAYQRRRNRQEETTVIAEYRDVLLQAQKSIVEFAKNYEDAISFLQRDDVLIYQSIHTLYVLFPETDTCLKPSFSRNWNSSIVETEQMADTFIQTVKPIRKRLALNLMEYPVILISGKKTMEGLLFLTVSITAHSRIPMAVLMDNDPQQLFWLRFIDNLHENGKRNIFHDVSLMQTFVDTHPICLSLVLTSDRIKATGLKVCIYADDSIKTVDCDLWIRFEEDITIQDYLNRKVWKMEYDSFYEKMVSMDLPPCNRTISSFHTDTDFLSIHGVKDVKSLCIRENHDENSSSRSLIATIGIDENGKMINLNMHEKKDGPHGIVGGMTGSGKSELLLTLVLSLACRYSPREVQFAFIDFKGGGLAEQLRSLPHTAGVLSNLDEMYFDKALSSFTRICTKRQQLLVEAGKRSGSAVRDIIAYRNGYYMYPDLPYPADLFILIDEFAQLRQICPEYMRDLIMLARIGRSLGIHLILCTQKPAGNISEEILSNCSFRIALKVADHKDSHELIGTSAAALFTRPGQFVLYTPTGMRQGQAGYANARLSEDGVLVETVDMDGSILDSSSRYVPQKQPQLTEVLNEIHFCCKDCAEPLWTQSIFPSLLENNEQHIFSMWDDIPGNMHHTCSMTDGSWLFACRLSEEKERLIQTLIYSGLSSGKDVVISGYHNSILSECACITVIKDEETDELLERLSSSVNQNLLWICCDLPYRKNEHMERRIVFDSIMERRHNFDIHVMLVVNDVTLLSIATLHSFEYVVAVRETSKNALVSVFETGSRPCRNQSGYGLIRIGHIIAEWCYRSVSQQKLQEALKSCIYVPSFHFGLPPCDKSRTPIGKGKTDWLYADSYQQLIIASAYDNPLYDMSIRLKETVSFQYGYDEQKNGIFLCDIDTARPVKNTVPVLLLDQGSVYGFSSDLRIHKGQALLFKDHHSEVITLVDA